MRTHAGACGCEERTLSTAPLTYGPVLGSSTTASPPATVPLSSRRSLTCRTARPVGARLLARACRRLGTCSSRACVRACERVHERLRASVSVRERARACLLVVDFDIRHARKELVVSLRLAPGHATTGWAHVSDAAAAMQRNGSVGALGRLCPTISFSTAASFIISSAMWQFGSLIIAACLRHTARTSQRGL